MSEGTIVSMTNSAWRDILVTKGTSVSMPGSIGSGEMQYCLRQYRIYAEIVPGKIQWYPRVVFYLAYAQIIAWRDTMVLDCEGTFGHYCISPVK